mmetsp:Transcript_28903/g.83495  ORF Transcript_28903/g.83495 Transcript_28903/m.83495 type:complete len:245 (+) Transcript_28903:2555-3289(+)
MAALLLTRLCDALEFARQHRVARSLCQIYYRQAAAAAGFLQVVCLVFFGEVHGGVVHAGRRGPLEGRHALAVHRTEIRSEILQQMDELSRTLEGGPVRRPAAVEVLGVEAGVLADEEEEGVCAAVLDGQSEWRGAQAVLAVDVGALAEEVPHECHPPLDGRPHQGRLPVGRLGVHSSAHVHQQLAEGTAVAQSRPVEERVALLVLLADQGWPISHQTRQLAEVARPCQHPHVHGRWLLWLRWIG